MSIPRSIFQIWLGDKPRPEKWMKTWKEKHPDWEYNVWNEKAIRMLPLKNEELFDKYKEMGMFYGMADVARIEILLKYGGIYIDADCECLESLEGAEFIDLDFFTVYANKMDKEPGRVSNGVIGAIKGHPIMEDYVKKMGEAKEITPCWRTIGGTLFTKCINDYGIEKVKILPPHYFWPENLRGTIKYKGKDKIYARHYWGQTKKLY